MKNMPRLQGGISKPQEEQSDSRTTFTAVVLSPAH